MEKRLDDDQPSLGYAWYVVGLLTLANISSFLDRQILALLVVPMKRDMHLSDTKLSLLMGLSFALFYTIFGIIISNRGYRHGPPEVMQRLAKGEPVDPKEYYFRGTPVFETSAENYKWITRYIFIATGTGERRVDRVILDFYKLL